MLKDGVAGWIFGTRRKHVLMINRGMGAVGNACKAVFLPVVGSCVEGGCCVGGSCCVGGNGFVGGVR